jgi:circadian clock protein KaiC
VNFRKAATGGRIAIGIAQSPIDLTYFADTALAPHFFEMAGSVRNAISAIKKTIRELTIDRAGIIVRLVLNQFRVVLTGVPITTQAMEK